MWSSSTGSLSSFSPSDPAYLVLSVCVSFSVEWQLVYYQVKMWCTKVWIYMWMCLYYACTSFWLCVCVSVCARHARVFVGGVKPGLSVHQLWTVALLMCFDKPGGPISMFLIISLITTFPKISCLSGPHTHSLHRHTATPPPTHTHTNAQTWSAVTVLKI